MCLTFLVPLVLISEHKDLCVSYGRQVLRVCRLASLLVNFFWFVLVTKVVSSPLSAPAAMLAPCSRDSAPPPWTLIPLKSQGKINDLFLQLLLVVVFRYSSRNTSEGKALGV